MKSIYILGLLVLVIPKYGMSAHIAELEKQERKYWKVIDNCVALRCSVYPKEFQGLEELKLDANMQELEDAASHLELNPDNPVLFRLANEIINIRVARKKREQKWQLKI